MAVEMLLQVNVVDVSIRHAVVVSLHVMSLHMLITFDVWVCLCHWGVKVWRIRTKSKPYPVSQEQREELRC